MPTDAEFLEMNQEVIAAFRANAGAPGQPPFAPGQPPFPPFPIVLLTTTGARSGKPTTTPLAYGTDEGRVYVVACKGGAPSDPAWFHNLRANPAVTVELGDHSYAATAVVVDSATRDDLYSKISKRVPDFGEYEQFTDRRFPVIVLNGIPAPS